MCDIKDAVVLVIDDCEDNLFLIEMILLQDGYRVEVANCGCEGVKKIHNLVPDLIILDMMMPDMTGIEVLKQIEPYQHLSRIPILFCTANTHIHQQDLKQIKNICYKPFDINELIAQVNSLVACCDRIKSPTIVIEVNEKDSLFVEHQKLISNYCDQSSTLEVLRNQGYEIFQR